MSLRPAGGDHHGVGQRALALQVDGDDVLRLVLVQPRQDQALQRIDVRSGGCGLCGWGSGDLVGGQRRLLMFDGC